MSYASVVLGSSVSTDKDKAAGESQETAVPLQTGTADLSRTQARSHLPQWVVLRKEYSDISYLSHPARVCRQEPAERATKDISVIAEWLSNVAVLNFASDSRLRALSRAVRYKRLEPRQQVIEEGQGGRLDDELWIVFSGQIAVHGEPGGPHKLLARLGPGLTVGKLDELYCRVVDGLRDRHRTDLAIERSHRPSSSSSEKPPAEGNHTSGPDGDQKEPMDASPSHLSALTMQAGPRGADILVIRRAEAREALAHLAIKLVWEDCDFLQSVDLFAEWSRFELLVLLRRMSRRVLPEGALVCRQGEQPTAVYFLKRGKCEVQRTHVESVKFSRGAAGAGTSTVRRVATLGEVAPGAIFGEGAVFRGTRRFADVVCSTACEVLALPTGQLLQLLSHGSLERLHDQAMGYGADKDVDRAFLRQVLAAKRASDNLVGLSREQSDERKRRGAFYADERKSSTGSASERRGTTESSGSNQRVWRGTSLPHSHRIATEDAAWGPPIPSVSVAEHHLLAEAIARERGGRARGCEMYARSQSYQGGLQYAATSDASAGEEPVMGFLSAVGGGVGNMLGDARANPLGGAPKARGRGEDRLQVLPGHEAVTLTAAGLPISPMRRTSVGGGAKAGGSRRNSAAGGHSGGGKEALSDYAPRQLVSVPSFALQRSRSRPRLDDGSDSDDDGAELSAQKRAQAGALPVPHQGSIASGAAAVLAGTRAGRALLEHEQKIQAQIRASGAPSAVQSQGNASTGVSNGPVLRRFRSFMQMAGDGTGSDPEDDETHAARGSDEDSGNASKGRYDDQASKMRPKKQFSVVPLARGARIRHAARAAVSRRRDKRRAMAVHRLTSAGEHSTRPGYKSPARLLQRGSRYHGAVRRMVGTGKSSATMHRRSPGRSPGRPLPHGMENEKVVRKEIVHDQDLRLLPLAPLTVETASAGKTKSAAGSAASASTESGAYASMPAQDSEGKQNLAPAGIDSSLDIVGELSGLANETLPSPGRTRPSNVAPLPAWAAAYRYRAARPNAAASSTQSAYTGWIDRSEEVMLVAAARPRLFEDREAAENAAAASNREMAMRRSKRATAPVVTLASPGVLAQRAADLIAKIDAKLAQERATEDPEAGASAPDSRPGSGTAVADDGFDDEWGVAADVRSFRVSPSRSDSKLTGEGNSLLQGPTGKSKVRKVEAARAHAAPSLELQEDSDASQELAAVAATGAMRLIAALNGDKGIRTPRWLMMLFILVFSLQILGFALSTAAPFHWHDILSIRYISLALGGVSGDMAGLGSAGLAATGAPSVLFAASAGLVGLNVVLVAVLTKMYADMEEFVFAGSPALALRILRVMADASYTALFIPVLRSLLSIVACQRAGSPETWYGSSLVCYDGAHIVLIGLALMLAAAWVAFACLAATTLMDRRRVTAQPLARAEGRTHAYCLAAVAIVCFAYSLFDYLSPWILTICSLVLGLYLVYQHLTSLPFSSHSVNQWFVALGAVAVWASVCQAASLLLVPDSRDGAGLSFLMAFPFVAFAGWTVTDMRWRSFDDVFELSSPQMVEVKIRRMLLHADSDVHASQMQQAGASLEGGLAAAAAIGRSKAQQFGAKPGHSSGSAHGSAYDDSEGAADAEHLLAEALDFFYGDPLMHIVAADFLRDIRGNKHLEQTHLQAASSLQPSIDTICLIFSRRQVMAAAALEQTVGGRVSVQARVRFEKTQEAAQAQAMRARAAIRDFWHRLTDQVVNVDRLSEIGARIHEGTEAAEAAYQLLLRINPSSVMALRQYALFLIEIKNDPLMAAKYVEQADALEEEATRLHTRGISGADFQMMGQQLEVATQSENVAVLVASYEPALLGTMVSVNQPATTMFGYTKRELIGQNINTVLPQPFSAAHDHFLRRYLASGREEMLNTSRQVFGLHKAGHIFPALLSVRQMEDGFGGIMQPLPISDNTGFILFMAPTGVVTGACPRSQRALRLTKDSIARAGVFLHKYLPQLGQFLDARGVDNPLPLALELAESRPAATTRLSGVAAKAIGKGGKHRRNSTGYSTGAPGALEIISDGSAGGTAAAAGSSKAVNKSSSRKRGTGGPRRQLVGAEELSMLEASDDTDTELGAPAVLWPSRQYMNSSAGYTLPRQAQLPHSHMRVWVQMQVSMPMKASILGPFGKAMPKLHHDGAKGTGGAAGRRARRRGAVEPDGPPERLQVCLLKWRPWAEEDSASVAASHMGGASVSGRGGGATTPKGPAVHGSPAFGASPGRSTSRTVASRPDAVPVSLPGPDVDTRKLQGRKQAVHHRDAGTAGSASGRRSSSGRSESITGAPSRPLAESAKAPRPDASWISLATELGYTEAMQPAVEDHNDRSPDARSGSVYLVGAANSRSAHTAKATGSNSPSGPGLHAGALTRRDTSGTGDGDSLLQDLENMEYGSSTGSMLIPTKRAAAPLGPMSGRSESKEAEYAPASARERRAAPRGTRQRRRSASVDGVGSDVPVQVLKDAAGDASEKSNSMPTIGSTDDVQGLLAPSSDHITTLPHTIHGHESKDAAPRLQTVERGSHGGSTQLDVESLHTFEGTVQDFGAADGRNRTSQGGSVTFSAGHGSGPVDTYDSGQMAQGKAHVTFATGGSSVVPRREGRQSAGFSGIGHTSALRKGLEGGAPAEKYKTSAANDGERSSVTSKTSRTSATTQLRRTLRRMSHVKETSLQLLNSALLLLFLVVACLAAAYIVMNRVLLGGLLADIDLVAQSGERQVVLYELLLDTQALVLGSEAIAGTQADWDAMVGRMEVHRAEFAHMHNELYLEAAKSSHSKTVQPDLSSNITERALAVARGYSQEAIEALGLAGDLDTTEALHSLYVHDVLPTHNLQAGRGVIRASGLLDAGVELSTKVRLSLAIDPHAWADLGHQSSVYFVRRNGPESIAAGSNDSSLLLHGRTEEHKARSEVIELSITLSSIGVLVLSLAVMVIPIIVGVERARDGIHRIFFHVPRKVVKFLRNDAQKRLDEIQAEEDGIDDDVDGGYQAAVVTVDGGGQGHGASEGPGAGHEDIDWSRIKFKSARGGQRESTKDSSRVVLNLLRFCLPVLVAAGCFALLREWTTSKFDDVEKLDNAVYYSEQRHAAMLQLEYYVARALETEDPATVRFYEEAVEDRAATVIRLQNALLYGSESLGVDGTLKASYAMHRLMLEDGCLPGGGGFDLDAHGSSASEPGESHAGVAGVHPGQNASHFQLASGRSLGVMMQATTTFTHAECAEFMDGLLGTGLHGALQHLAEDALDIVGTHAASIMAHSGNSTASLAARRNRVLYALSEGKVQDFRRLAGVFADSGLYEATDIHRQITRATVNTFLDWQVTACVLFVLALGATHVWSNRTAIADLDTEMKRVRGLTLLLPEAVVSGIPEIREEVEKNLEGADTAALDRVTSQASTRGGRHGVI